MLAICESSPIPAAILELWSDRTKVGQSIYWENLLNRFLREIVNNLDLFYE